jgi:hypothetical protein
VCISAVGHLAGDYGPVRIIGIMGFATYLCLSCTDTVSVLCQLYVYVKTHPVKFEIHVNYCHIHRKFNRET